MKLTPEEFLQWTPKEIQKATEVWAEDRALEIREDYERTRLSVYYSYLLTPTYSKGAVKKTYDEFRKEFFKLPWDEKTAEPEVVQIDWDAIEREDQELRGKVTKTEIYKVGG